MRWAFCLWLCSARWVPLTGLRQMVIARFAFGWDAAKLTALFNIAACIGWSCVNAIIGGVLFHSIWHWPFAVCLLIIAGLTTLVSVYGNNLVQRYERYAWIPLAVIFIIIAITAAPTCTQQPLRRSKWHGLRAGSRTAAPSWVSPSAGARTPATTASTSGSPFPPGVSSGGPSSASLPPASSCRCSASS